MYWSTWEAGVATDVNDGQRNTAIHRRAGRQGDDIRELREPRRFRGSIRPRRGVLLLSAGLLLSSVRLTGRGRPSVRPR